MRDHNDVMNNVFRRRDEYEAAQKQKRKTAVKAGTFITGLCLVGIIGFSISQRDLFKNSSDITDKQIADDSTILGMTDTIDDKNSLAQETNQVKINMNYIEFVPQTSADIGLMWEDYTAFSKEEAIGYYGTNIYPMLPEDINKEYSGIVGVFKRDGGTGEIYHSTFEMSYCSDDFSREITVKGDKGQMPFSCAVMNFDEQQLKATEINGEAVYFATFGDNAVYAEFMYNNVGFELTFKGLSDEEIVSVVSSLLS